ncbi:uncharacterized protein LOC117609876 [Osmia lignaria lignaria]|uniref:superoxide dismutase [Cu-Zn] 2-like n=1 Tax=Osmia bicornis bicornis TaxID=1437191 RepID=UPI0010F6591D|nr:superoxide dismutase [Cu-Zn] 2-like [Osmia bicornis bicornis]XP_034192517.1 superoxide dismutase [Cu-Zn] 2-like [Osmia lignaria]XP_034192519.1 superoxide dismutase [Cu-Zn] 2-like [Osmia lignaria]
MNRMIVLLLGVVVAVSAEQKTAHVHLVPHNAETKNVTGELTITQSADNTVEITGTVYGLTEGLHGFHVHEKADMREGCNSTGPHFNPTNATHGAPDSAVRHVGDLGNIRANAQGEASVNIKDTVISLTGVNSILGRAIVVHSGEDDLGRGNTTLSATTGNAGGRWACGVIEAK